MFEPPSCGFSGLGRGIPEPCPQAGSQTEMRWGRSDGRAPISLASGSSIPTNPS